MAGPTFSSRISANEPNTLYREPRRRDCSRTGRPPAGMANDSLPWVGWGCVLADLDNDGWPDCFVANGHVDDNLHLLDRNSPYAQPPLLHRNLRRDAIPAGDS